MTNQSRNLVITAGLATAVFLLFSGHVPGLGRAASSAGTLVRPTVAVLGDNSLDASANDLAQAQLAVRRASELAAPEGGRVVAATFQNHALAYIAWPLDHTFGFDSFVPAGNTALQRADLRRQISSAVTQAARIFNRQQRRGVEGSDIIGSLLAAGQVFRSDPAATPKIVVLASNMLDVSPSDGLEMTRQRLSRTFVERSLSRLVADRAIADLTGVCVYVVGGGLGTDHPLSTANELGLQSFWTSYFARANARVVAWTPTLQHALACTT